MADAKKRQGGLRRDAVSFIVDPAPLAEQFQRLILFASATRKLSVIRISTRSRRFNLSLTKARAQEKRGPDRHYGLLPSYSTGSGILAKRESNAARRKRKSANGSGLETKV
jgi:hypothetical protein